MKIRTKWNKAWEVLEVESFEGGHVGECRPDTRQIVIESKHNGKLWTLLHEIIHAVSFDYDLDLTEQQVVGLEKGLSKVLILSKPSIKRLVEKYQDK